jgi:ABC-type polysaccharide/polyol phosphate export permease
LVSNLERLVGAKDLLYMLAWRDVRVRYKQSVMGFFWAVLLPSIVVGAGVLVRFAASRWSGTSITTDDVASIMVRAVAWSFLVSSVRFGTNSLVGNPNLVTKLAFPKEVFPISSVLSSLFDFAIGFGAVLLIMLLMGWVPTVQALWVVPLLLILSALAAGVSLLLAAANLFYRDVKYLVEVLLTYAIFFTPVLYDARALGRWEHLVLLNPAAPLLEALSQVLVYGKAPDLGWVAYSLCISVAVLGMSYWLFKQLEPKFAENI